MATWLRYIACDGQTNMARIGYSPLPPNLSQEVANSIARLTGQPAEQLNASNCANPRFQGSVGEGGGAPPDPLAGVTSIGTGTGSLDSTTVEGGAAGGASGKEVTVKSSGGGSSDWRKAVPVAYAGASIPSSNTEALLALLVIMAAPMAWSAVRSRRRKTTS